MKKNLFILILGTFTCVMNAQDPQFTQFAGNPIYLNPAFTGNTNVHRFTAAYRSQWPGIKKTYNTYMAAYDKNVDKKNSGVGFYVMQDRAGTTGYTNTFGAVNYAYRIKTGFSSAVRMALSAGGGQTRNDFSKIVMNDQFITGSATSADVPVTNTRAYFDLGTGVAFTSNHFWAGYAVKHINQPSRSIVGADDKVPASMTTHMGVRKVIRPNDTSDANPLVSMSFLMNYRHEKKYDQFDLGMVFYARGVSVGMWYRGIPMKRIIPNNSGSECVAFMLGYALPAQGLRLAYSYDLTVSSLGNSNTTGAHELSLGFEFGKKGPIEMAKKKNVSIKKKF